MAKSKIEVQPGKVANYDPDTGVGRIDIADTKGSLEFKSVDFRSGRPTRFPRHGEEVEVVLAQGVMVSVRSIQG